MRNLLAHFALIGLLACVPDDATPTNPVNDTFDPTQATLLRSGTLSGCGGHSVMGKAEVYDFNGSLVLLFDDFTAENGPDLRVYMSTTTSANDFVYLDKLKSVNGKQSYDIPPGTDLDVYKYAHIWCQKYSVCFGVALTN
jgi:hypothetical protein